MENKFKNIASPIMFLVFLIAALACFYFSVYGLNTGLALAPTTGMFLFGMAFLGLAFASKEIIKLCCKPFDDSWTIE